MHGQRTTWRLPSHRPAKGLHGIGWGTTRRPSNRVRCEWNISIIVKQNAPARSRQVEPPIGEVARFNRGAQLGVQCVGGLVCGDGWDGSRCVVDHLIVEHWMGV